MPEVSSRSIGIQVDLCNCSCQLNLLNQKDSTVAPLALAEEFMTSCCRDPESTPLCETEGMSSSDQILSEDVVDRCPRQSADLEEVKRVLREEDEGKGKSQSRAGSTSSPTYPSGLSHEMKRQVSATRTSSSDSMSNVKRDSATSHHSYHFRRKLANFRSDSVFSDVMPTTSSSSSNQDPRKGSDPSEKGGGRGSGSLSSLKHKESKWISLRKKLKINSSSSSSSISKKLEKKDGDDTPEPLPPLKNVAVKRSLFQRAKTLAILPVAKVKGDSSSEDSRPDRHHRHRKHQHVVQQPKELFNVGGEMNMIPLEFLIDINDLNLGSK